MLPWQQNVHEWSDDYYAQSRPDLQKKAFITSLIIYILLCVPLLVGPLEKKEVIAVVVHANARPVLFLPPKKGASKGAAQGGKMRASASLKKEATPKEPVPKKAVSKKELKPKEIKSKELKQAKTAPEPQKKSPVLIEKKVEKKIEKKPEKKMVKKELEKKQKKEEPVVPQKPESAPAIKEVTKEPVKPVPQVPEKVIEEDIYVTQNGEAEGEAGEEPVSKAHRALSHALGRVWKAPRVAIKKPLRMLIEVTDKGTVASATIQETSGTTAYDIAARAAALRAEYPREFWGKKLAIIFGDEGTQ